MGIFIDQKILIGGDQKILIGLGVLHRSEDFDWGGIFIDHKILIGGDIYGSEDFDWWGSLWI